MKSFFLLLLVFITLLFATPSWLSLGGNNNSGGSGSSGAAVKRVAVHDTVYVDRVQFDTVVVVDTVVKIDTVVKLPVQYKYVVRYALTSLNVEMTNPAWLDYASVNEIVARDTATLRIGSEEIRTIGNIIDSWGNKVPQQDIITAGFTININGDRVVIEYRGKNSLAMFSGSFDKDGFLFATGEITESSFALDFFPFNLFFGASKKRIIIEIFREVRL